ncbi:MAG: hypothetical protein PVH31_04595 [Ectothiorhodospiraceae bacterium]
MPWKFLLRRAARAHGFMDPVAFIARLQRFAQPSEVAEPIELLRAGVVFHARGLVNTRVIQHNLDWIWPYWIERQFDPHDESFLPRAFSITHVNLTHRNWTAVGLPDCAELPIVDPRGLVTPFLDGWSLDGWVLGSDGRSLYPSRCLQAGQSLETEDGVAVATEAFDDGLRLEQRAWVERRDGVATLCIAYRARAEAGGRFAVALRPYNPEGISFIHDVALTGAGHAWSVDGRRLVEFDQAPAAHFASDYQTGDVANHLDDAVGLDADSCDVGLATAAALFELRAGETRSVNLRVPLEKRAPQGPATAWRDVLRGAPKLEVPDERFRFLYQAALRTLVLHSVEDVYPGPYTYKRFWFRDAAFICHALLAAGLPDRARRSMERFPDRQNAATGYFHSQEGEWDSNGQVLWIANRYEELTGERLGDHWLSPLRKGARWIVRKRLSGTHGEPHAGLLPAGFSAEHLGPNDYYYWDDFWGVAGLEAAAQLMGRAGDTEAAAEYRRQAAAFRGAVDAALARDFGRLGVAAIPASPYRRLDSGAVGSLAAGYPLQLYSPETPGLLGTVNFLMDNSRVHGGFFQDMIHSGVNAYLSLHLAQVLLRARDERCFDVVDAVARLATSTGQWPEAIHPRTLGGCMGDGQHVWAAADWVLMQRNAFVREEGDCLVLAAGIPRRWVESGEWIRFGPAPTRFGTVEVSVGPMNEDGDIPVHWNADWREMPAAVEAGPVWLEPVTAAPGDGAVTVRSRRDAGASHGG